jgi:hypothetical protein
MRMCPSSALSCLLQRLYTVPMICEHSFQPSVSICCSCLNPQHIALINIRSVAVINAENASLKSPKFAIPNARAREGILANLIKTGMQPGLPTSITRSSTSGVGGDPLSARVRRGAVRSESSLVSPSLPPMPTPSRSSMLKELTGLARRRSGIQDKGKKEKEPPRRAMSAPTRDKDAKNKASSKSAVSIYSYWQMNNDLIFHFP